MTLMLSLFFTFNLISSAIMVKLVFPTLQKQVETGLMAGWMAKWAMASLVIEGAVSAISMITLFESAPVSILEIGFDLWILAAYAAANANLFCWVAVYHQRKWRNDHHKK